MRCQFLPLLAILPFSSSIAITKPFGNTLEQWDSELEERNVPQHTSPRPSVSCSPKKPSKPQPPSPPREKVCYVRSHNDSITDDSEYILSALHSCNNGGHVVFKEGLQYTIGTALDLTFLNHIDIGNFTYHPKS